VNDRGAVRVCKYERLPGGTERLDWAAVVHQSDLCALLSARTEAEFRAVLDAYDSGTFERTEAKAK
jgi:hypothetical protein